jgi:hypothetical protein
VRTLRTTAERARMRALDQCLQILEDALADGKVRVDGPLAYRLRHILGAGGLVPDHRLEGRRIDRVLDDIFALQARLLGQDEEEAAG